MTYLALPFPTLGVPAAVSHCGRGQNGAVLSPYTVAVIEPSLCCYGTEAVSLLWGQYSHLGLAPIGVKDE